MRILLDTCEFLWLVAGDAKLFAPVASAVRDPQNQGFLSAVSFWEISLKHSLGKLPLSQSPAQFVPLQRERHLIAPPALDEAAVAQLSGLPMLHRDPFDRMLVCQAQAHGLTIASSDSLIGDILMESRHAAVCTLHHTLCTYTTQHGFAKLLFTYDTGRFFTGSGREDAQDRAGRGG